MWRDPNKCSAVAGNIDSQGWCEWFAGGAYGKRGKQVDEEGALDSIGGWIKDKLGIDDEKAKAIAGIKKTEPKTAPAGDKKVEPKASPTKKPSEPKSVAVLANSPLFNQHEKKLISAGAGIGMSITEVAAFLSQCAVETGNFTSLVERGSANYVKRYEPRFKKGKKKGTFVQINPIASRVGNTRRGDGERFKGRGYIQLTGRWNYTEAARSLKNEEILTNPNIVGTPTVGLSTAIWFWQKFVRSDGPNWNDTAAVTLAVNGGSNGLDKRRTYFEKYKAMLSKASGNKVEAITPTYNTENFADGKKPGRKGLAKRSGVNTKASVSSLRKTAKNSSGEKQRMAHWMANMKAGTKK
jgi:putative chitinase